MNAIVQKSVLDFLKKLEKNNNRDWFNDHKNEFKVVEKNIKQVYNAV